MESVVTLLPVSWSAAAVVTSAVAAIIAIVFYTKGNKQTDEVSILYYISIVYINIL